MHCHSTASQLPPAGGVQRSLGDHERALGQLAAVYRRALDRESVRLAQVAERPVEFVTQGVTNSTGTRG
jgi:hypothetical protein